MRWFRTRQVYVPSPALIAFGVELMMLNTAIECALAENKEREAEQAQWETEGGALALEPPPLSASVRMEAEAVAAFCAACVL